MIGDSGEAPREWWRAYGFALVTACLFGVGACSRDSPPPRNPVPTETLRIGFGSVNGQSALSGLRQYLNLVEREALIVPTRDGRLRPLLADRWASSADRRSWRIHLRENATFHNGHPVTAAIVSQFLNDRLPAYLGPSAKDIESIAPVSDHELQLTLNRPSTLILEGLDLAIEEPGSGSGTGPFYSIAHTTPIELRANPRYHSGIPLIDHIVIKTYDSTRAAWAEMLRGEVDVVYEVGADSIDSLQPSNAVKVFSRLRNYSYVLLLNQRQPRLASRELRRNLNAAIDRTALVAKGLYGHGRPADGPVWPQHWAHESSGPHFSYAPTPTVPPLVLTCLFADPSLERLALVVQKQLAAVGVVLKLELLSIDELYRRANAGTFDVFLADALLGPTLFWPNLFWRSDGPYNWGNYRNPKVDRALDAIRDAADDEEYRMGVAAFQQAIVDDPPAVFLAWSERARAVSTRFDVPADSERDIIATLRFWKPIAVLPAGR